MQKCKINSRNFTYDSLTFSCSSLVLEQVKDEIWNCGGLIHKSKDYKEITLNR
jgi:hypothetical protein